MIGGKDSRLIVRSAVLAIMLGLCQFVVALDTGESLEEDSAAPTAKAGTVMEFSAILEEEELAEEFPLWARDLRRAEIVAFGSLPFTLFLSRIGVDTWRWSSNAWNMQYAPWPLKGTNALDMTSDEARISIAVAFGSSALIALADHFIVRHRRDRAKAQARQRARSTLEIEALESENREDSDPETPSTDKPSEESKAPESGEEVLLAP